MGEAVIRAAALLALAAAGGCTDRPSEWVSYNGELGSRRFSELSLSPRRNFLAAQVERPRGFVFVDSDGRSFALREIGRDNYGRPPFTAGRAVAWSADDSWTAVARSHDVVFFRMGSESPDVVNVQVTAHDLAWATASGVRDPSPDHRSTNKS